MVQCRTCGATYEPVLPDGMEYYHACPPLSFPELKDALDQGAVQLTPAQQKQLDAAKARDAAGAPKDGVPSQADIVLGSFVVERPDRRDENVVPARTRGDEPGIKAIGKGDPVPL